MPGQLPLIVALARRIGKPAASSSGTAMSRRDASVEIRDVKERGKRCRKEEVEESERGGNAGYGHAVQMVL